MIIAAYRQHVVRERNTATSGRLQNTHWAYRTDRDKHP